MSGKFFKEYSCNKVIMLVGHKFSEWCFIYRRRAQYILFYSVFLLNAFLK